MKAEYGTVEIAVRDAVAVISLNRLERHDLIDPATRAALLQAFRHAEEDPAARAIVLRGEGRSFCSWRDRDAFLDPAGFGSQAALVDHGQAIRRVQMAMTKPVICVLKGHVIGGGAELALSCDFRITADDLQFRFVEAGFVVGDTGSSLLLPQLIGAARATWLLMSGATIGGAEAVAWGLAEWSVPVEELDKAAVSHAATLARQPQALAAQKRQIDAVMRQGFAEAIDREKAAILALFDGAEFAALHAEG